MNWPFRGRIPRTPLAIGAIAAAWGAMAAEKPSPYGDPLRVPRLERPATIDGDLSEWKNHAFTDGLWDMARLRQTPWYDPAINRLTDHGNEPALQDDLAARYYMAWDDRFLYLGAEVKGAGAVLLFQPAAFSAATIFGSSARPRSRW